MNQHYEYLHSLTETIEGRIGDDPAKSYVAQLSDMDADAVLKKIGEEAIEVVLAAKNGVTDEICKETADLLFHLMIMLAQHQLSLEDVVAALENRSGVSGLREKALRSLDDSG